MLSMIAAMGKNRVIGKDNKMPWHLPADLQHFKQTTLHAPIIMGRKTYESIGRPLPGRLNIVLSRDPDLTIEGCSIAHSMDEALLIANTDASSQASETNNEIKRNYSKKNNEVFITGGAYLYEMFLDKADRLYLTQIDAEFSGDTFFPDYTRLQWKEAARSDYPADENNPHAYSFITLDRIR